MIFTRAGAGELKKWRKPWKREESAQRVPEGNPAPSLVCTVQI